MTHPENTPPISPGADDRPSGRRATHVCAFCGGAFDPAQPRQRYCSPTHRKAAWAAEHPRLTVTRAEFMALAGLIFDDMKRRQARRE